MERKCKNCMCYSPSKFGDGSHGTCGQSGTLVVHDREHQCDCGKYVELPKSEKIRRTIEKVLSPWVRERDEKFKRALEIVGHIGQLFESGEFKVFDVVRSAMDMKGLIFYGKPVITEVKTVWTYHCPWEDDREHYIIITEDNKMVINCWMDGKFITNWFDCDEQFDICMKNIDKIRLHCITGCLTSDAVHETEDCKCVMDELEIMREKALNHPINSPDRVVYPR